MADSFSRVMERWLPDAFLFAVLITILVFIAATGIQLDKELAMSQALINTSTYWGDGIWRLLTFAMQMVLILVLGHILALAAPVQKLIGSIASYVQSVGQAIVVTTVVAMLASWLNWGFGLVIGAVMAKEIARRVENVHYPLLVASAYSGFLIWHAGLSGSIPLKIASPGNDALGLLLNQQAIPLSQTIFSGQVLIIVGALVITLPLVNWMMMPKKAQPYIETEPNQQSSPIQASLDTPAQKMEHSPVINLLLATLIMSYCWVHFIQRDAGLGLNQVNLILLVMGLILHWRPTHFLNAAQTAIKGCSGIVLQFPLYAGIMGMMTQSGLAAEISQWFVDISTRESFPIYTFLSAGVVNFFVPSGGGQWAIQAPLIIPAAESLQVPLNQAAMAVAFGDAWTNMIQPFWALPLLGIAGLSIRQIMGYCTVILLWSGLVICIGLWCLY
nr:TIGR00366 family protein [Pleionea sp. CnH1-48]